MPETSIKYGMNVILSGFKLEPIEMVSVRKAIETNFKRILRISGDAKLKIDLAITRHKNGFLHKINAHLNVGKGNFGSEREGFNLYNALNLAMEDLTKQASKHKEK